MKACRTASIVFFGGFFAASAIGACRESAPPNVPPLTTAAPTASTLVTPAAAPAGPRTVAAWLEGTKKLEPDVCSRLYVVVASGATRVGNDTLLSGDVLVVVHPEPVEVKVSGLALIVTHAMSAGASGDCAVLSRPPVERHLIRAREAPELRFSSGAMRAHLDVGPHVHVGTGQGPKVSPDLYVGRLEGTAAVPEHDHPASIETIAAIEASGTYTVDGKELRLASRQIVSLPKGTRHSYKPDPGSKLVAIQIYDPPGPEQRFVALAAAEKDAGQ